MTTLDSSAHTVPSYGMPLRRDNGEPIDFTNIGPCAYDPDDDEGDCDNLVTYWVEMYGPACDEHLAMGIIIAQDMLGAHDQKDRTIPDDNQFTGLIVPVHQVYVRVWPLPQGEDAEYEADTDTDTE